MKKSWRAFLALALVAFLTIIAVEKAYSQDRPEQSIPEQAETTENAPVTADIVIDGETLLTIREPLGLPSLQDRAKAITNSIKKVARDRSISPEKLEVVEKNGLTVVSVGETILISIGDADAKITNRPRQEIAQEYREKLAATIERYREERTSEYLLRAAFYAGMISVAFLIVGIVINFIFPKVFDRINSLRYTRLPSIGIQNFELLSSDRIADLSISFLKTIRSLLNLSIGVLYLPIVCQLFPWTRPFSKLFWRYLRSAANLAWDEFVKYFPNLFSIALVIILTAYILRFIKPIFDGISQGTISLPGFYADWADPTYRLLEIGILSLAAVIIFPYLPGFGSPAFQGVSVFIGILFSLGSTTAIANVVAGIILIYTRAFQVGDRVKVADILGDVEEKLLLVTRIRTSYNVIVTIPNASLLSSNIINYSASIRDTKIPLILSVSITLNYHIPWRQAHQLLIEAAIVTPNVLEDPAPFVHQSNLGNSFATYEIKVYTKNPYGMAGLYSSLYQNIQDKFYEAGIEIVSPQYSAVRDGNASTLPENYLSPDYKPPGFQLHSLGNLFQIDLKLGAAQKTTRKTPTSNSSDPMPNG